MPVQSKMARAALGLNVHGVSGLSGDTVSRFEKGKPVPADTVAKLRAAYEDAGLEFIPADKRGPGVRFAKPLKEPGPNRSSKGKSP